MKKSYFNKMIDNFDYLFYAIYNQKPNKTDIVFTKYKVISSKFEKYKICLIVLRGYKLNNTFLLSKYCYLG